MLTMLYAGTREMDLCSRRLCIVDNATRVRVVTSLSDLPQRHQHLV